MLEWLVGYIRDLDFDKFWKSGIGNKSYPQVINNDIIERFDKKYLPEIIEEDVRLYRKVMGDKPRDIIFPEWRFELFVDALDREKDYHIGRIADKKFRFRDAGDKDLRAIFEVDWLASKPEIKVSKDRERETFSTGAGKYYAPYWKAIAKVCKEFYMEASTSFMVLLTTAK